MDAGEWSDGKEAPRQNDEPHAVIGCGNRRRRLRLSGYARHAGRDIVRGEPCGVEPCELFVDDLLEAGVPTTSTGRPPVLLLDEFPPGEATIGVKVSLTTYRLTMTSSSDRSTRAKTSG